MADARFGAAVIIDTTGKASMAFVESKTLVRLPTQYHALSEPSAQSGGRRPSEQRPDVLQILPKDVGGLNRKSVRSDPGGSDSEEL